MTDTAIGEGLEEPLVPPPAAGRVYRSGRRVRLADADARGRLRLDGCARYVQDAGNDDTSDSGIDDPSTTWVARRAVIDVHAPPRWGEQVDLATWCGGLGGRWAERRLSVHGDAGGRVEVATLWIHIDVRTGAPLKLAPSFHELYAPAANGRKVTSRRWLGGVDAAAVAVAWPLRAVDVDLLGHVNNAAYWAAVEEQLLGEPTHPLLAAPHRAVIEYGPAIAPGAPVELRVRHTADALAVWFTVSGTTHAAARVSPLPAG